MSIFVRGAVTLIRCYQWILSPWVGFHCRFQPTCSHYAIESIEKRGLIVGFWLTIRRIFRCNPWGASGYDPVPVKKELK